MRRVHVGQCLVVVGIDEQQRGPAVLDDVGDLVARQAEVDGDHDAARRRRAVEEVEHAGGVRADHRDPLAGGDAHGVEAGGDCARATMQLGEGQLAQAAAGLVGLVDHRDAIGIDRRAAGEEVVRRQGNEHRAPWGADQPAHTTIMGTRTSAADAIARAMRSSGRRAAKQAACRLRPVSGSTRLEPSISPSQTAQALTA
jgi:hypothetical protein